MRNVSLDGNVVAVVVVVVVNDVVATAVVVALVDGDAFQIDSRPSDVYEDLKIEFPSEAML